MGKELAMVIKREISLFLKCLHCFFSKQGRKLNGEHRWFLLVSSSVLFRIVGSQALLSLKAQGRHCLWLSRLTVLGFLVLLCFVSVPMFLKVCFRALSEIHYSLWRRPFSNPMDRQNWMSEKIILVYVYRFSEKKLYSAIKTEKCLLWQELLLTDFSRVRTFSRKVP